MNTNIHCGTIHIHDRITDLEHFGAAGAARHSGPRPAHLDRVQADRELILRSWEPATAPLFTAMPAVAGTTIDVGAVAVPSDGYASPGGTGGIAGGLGEGVAAAASTTTATKRELAFLDDRSLSIEEKLFRFMALMTSKADKELVAKMKEFGGSKSSTSSSSGSGSTPSPATPPASAGEPTGPEPTDPGVPADPGSPADPPVNPALPPPYNRMTLEEMHDKYGFEGMVNILQRGDPTAYAGFASAFDKVGPVLADGVAWAAHELVGPALGYAVTAMGMPELAPIAKMLGTKLGDAVGDEVKSLAHHDDAARSPQATDDVRKGLATGRALLASADETADDATATVAAKASSSSASPAASTVDEQLQFLTLQRLVEKQNSMFTAMSNVLKLLHDTRMAAVQNLR